MKNQLWFLNWNHATFFAGALLALTSCSGSKTSVQADNGALGIYSFNDPSQYAFDSSQIEMVGRVARLVTINQTDVDDSNTGFGGGLSSGVSWNASINALTPNASGGMPSFTSRVMDAHGVASWSSIAWVPLRPSWKELPNNNNSETGYGSGNAVMGGNVLLLHLNESPGASQFADGSGFNNAGHCSSGSCPVAGSVGLFNQALSFSGGQQVTVAASPTLNSRGQISIETWLSPTSNGSGPILGYDNGSSAGISLFQSTDGAVSADFMDSSGTSHVISSGPGVLSVGKWNHVAAVYNGAAASIYVNGVEVTSGGSPQPLGSISLQTSFPLVLGARLTGGSQYYSGEMDEVAIFQRALSASEVSDHFLRGALRLKLQVRSCADAACANGTFIGPSGDGSTYYSELMSDELTTPSLSGLTIPANRYFQYRAFFESDVSSFLPALAKVAIGPSHYAGGSPSLTNLVGLKASQLTHFIETLGANCIGATRYQLSQDGVHYLYYDGSKWAPGLDATTTNSAEEINAWLPYFKFPDPPVKFYFKVFFVSVQALQPVELQQVLMSGMP